MSSGKDTALHYDCQSNNIGSMALHDVASCQSSKHLFKDTLENVKFSPFMNVDYFFWNGGNVRYDDDAPMLEEEINVADIPF